MRFEIGETPKIKSDLKRDIINAHINTITLFSVHLNTKFGFINRNDLVPIETKGVHVNIAIVYPLLDVYCVFFSMTCPSNLQVSITDIKGL